MISTARGEQKIRPQLEISNSIESFPLFSAHDFAVLFDLVVKSYEMKPAMDQVKAEFARKRKFSNLCLLDRLVHGNANFTCQSFGRIRGKGDDVGGAEILKKITVNSGMA